MDTIYRECANGRWEYWFYSDGQRVYVSRGWAILEASEGRAHIVIVDATVA